MAVPARPHAGDGDGADLACHPAGLPPRARRPASAGTRQGRAAARPRPSDVQARARLVAGTPLGIHHSQFTTHIPCFDGNGNVIAQVNAGSGQPSARYEYAPFGEPLRLTGDAAKLNPFRFSTKYTDDETGLLYYGYRYYCPILAKWLNRDPLEEEGGLNLYAFVQNNPISSVDALVHVTLGDVLITGSVQDDAKLAQAKTGSSLISRVKEAGEAYSDIQDFVASVSEYGPEGMLEAGLQLAGDHLSARLRGGGTFARMMHEHHSDPVFMGGAKGQTTTRMDPNDHRQLHRDMNDYLSGKKLPGGDPDIDHMRPQSNNSGKRIRRNFSPQERLEALADFYRTTGSKYVGAAKDFFTQHSGL
ncbi:MAG: RHS repeat-associated core domain-containing protein [Verrucomicrobia bacterium]|nr:RHS repeat-associated core domain-containing protein [Verrucomicrobiota bacterium]